MIHVFVHHGHEVRFLLKNLFVGLVPYCAISLQFLGILKDNEGQIIDTQDFFARFTLDSFAGIYVVPAARLFSLRTGLNTELYGAINAEIAFGKVVGSLKQPVAFSEAFNSATRNTDLRFAMPWWRVQNAIQIPS